MYLQILDGFSPLTLKLKTETEEEKQVLTFANHPFTAEFLLKLSNYNYRQSSAILKISPFGSH
jgi:hypothetical protein